MERIGLSINEIAAPINLWFTILGAAFIYVLQRVDRHDPENIDSR